MAQSADPLALWLTLACYSLCAQAGIPGGSADYLTDLLALPMLLKKGSFWRVALLLLHLLGLEPAAAALQGTTDAALQVPPPFAGSETAKEDVIRSACRLAAPGRTRQLAERMLLALARLQARRRLPEYIMSQLLEFLRDECGLSGDYGAVLTQVRGAWQSGAGGVVRRPGMLAPAARGARVPLAAAPPIVGLLFHWPAWLPTYPLLLGLPLPLGCSWRRFQWIVCCRPTAT